MKRKDVVVGEKYLSRVSGGLVVVTVLKDRGESYDWRTNKSKHVGFDVKNERTGKELVRSAAALRERKKTLTTVPLLSTPLQSTIDEAKEGEMVCCNANAGVFPIRYCGRVMNHTGLHMNGPLSWTGEEI